MTLCKILLPAASLIVLLLAAPSSAVTKFEILQGKSSAAMRPSVSDLPNSQIELHKINNLLLAITNNGSFGTQFTTYIDPETGLAGPSCEFPAGSNVSYLYVAGLWAGAVVGRDTLVSVGTDGSYNVREFWPPAGEAGGIVRRSNMKTSREFTPEAVSEQDFICRFSDTITDIGLTSVDQIDNRPHVPLGLEIEQRSYGWSYSYAEDFILFDYTIRNINRYPIQKLYFGIYVDADVYHMSRQGGGEAWTDDVCGYLHSVPSADPPGFEDTVRIAWNADNDGDPNADAGNVFDYSSATGLTGTEVLRSPNPDLQFAFNWWIANTDPSLDWGPRKAGTDERPFRDFGTGMGSPRGDLNKYYVMSSHEFDYDQMESAVNHSGEGWLSTPRNAPNFADGYDNRYLLSFGPFNLAPGDTLPITLAYVAGENFHGQGDDYRNYWNPYNPWPYIDRLDFTDLGRNARWAAWVFDNPGVDTDGDGDSGAVRWVVDSTTMDSTGHYYAGDGVPDFRGASPPPAPELRVTPSYGSLRIRWNGQASENTIDVFSNLKDFEGFRVYYGEDNRASDFVMLASYDRYDFNMYVWNAMLQRWEITEMPLMVDSLRILFGPDFSPDLYDSPERAYRNRDGFYYFTPQDWNVSDLSDRTGIYRLYPDADPLDVTDTTADGFHRYYEYEYVLENLQPSKPYYVTVTAFDFGSRKIALSSLESAPNLNSVRAYPLPSSDVVEEEALEVVVYPNPYRIDGRYAAAGYENRARTRSAERSRLIHFFNLPKVCKIRIYTLSGDLVKLIDHYNPEGGPESQHETWDVISRNTQAVVTGIYLYHVSSAMGEQLGKLVIIK